MRSYQVKLRPKTCTDNFKRDAMLTVTEQMPLIAAAARAVGLSAPPCVGNLWRKSFPESLTV